MLQPYTVNGVELCAQEWWYDLFLRYGLDSPDLPHYCDSCNATFSICHVLYYKQDGLVVAHHNELHDGVADLSGKFYAPTRVRDDTLISAGCAVKRQKSNPARSKSTKATSAMPPL